MVRVPTPRGTCGSARGRQPLPLKQTRSLLSRGGSVQEEAMCVRQGALDPGQAWGGAINWTGQGGVQAPYLLLA